MNITKIHHETLKRKSNTALNPKATGGGPNGPTFKFE